MTLGNNQPPLTRRQARELANGHQPAVADVVPSADVPADSVVPAGAAPKSAAPKGAAPKGAAPKRPAPEAPPAVSVFAPRTPTTGWSDAVASPRQPVPDRTMTRRELRALAAEKSHAERETVPTASAGTVSASTDSIDSNSHPFGIAALHIPMAPAKVAPPVEFMVEATPRVPKKSRPGVLHPPVGHWSLDREEADDRIPGLEQLEPFDQIMSRGISAGGIPTTTNALILPSIPHQGATSGPLTSTGEIMITGSIDLPRSLGATGQHPNLYDSSDMDQMLEQLDEAGHNSDVSPVSASRAVSTHASTRNVMAPPPRRGLTLPTVLTITAGVLAFGVLALFVAGYVFRIF
jgi:hypothetical protein